jgi:large subunit ribosomal protein L29
MKAKDMREKSSADLLELEKSLTRDAFQARFKNFTNRLDDTSSLKKARREVARVKTILVERQHIGEATPSASSVTAAVPVKSTPKKSAPKKTAPAKAKAPAKAASAGTAKKPTKAKVEGSI